MKTETKQVKHTPGPWTTNDTSIEQAETSERRKVAWIASCDSQGCNEPSEDKANARLIAAAPDLLEACKAISTDPGDMASGHERALRLVRAAIAKAEGRI